jgi:hypothetical protein
VISEKAIRRAARASARFRPAVLAAKYHPDSDRVEFVTGWCTLIVDRQRIAELRGLSLEELRTISVSAVGVHVDGSDIDINAAGLIADVARQLESEVANSF